jgi:hypothetical protein
MTIDELISVLYRAGEQFGTGAEVVLWDLDSSGYFVLRPEHVEGQTGPDGVSRVSIGLNAWTDESAGQPLARPTWRP